MNHPGVKSLFDRICKTNGLKPLQNQKQNDDADLFEVKVDHQSLNDSLIIVDNDNQKSQVQMKLMTDFSSQQCKLISFKEQLKLKMKEKRQQIRKEEEEDDLMDEEYHKKEEKDEVVVAENKKTDKNEDSDNEDFKLNLNDDEESQDEEEEEFGIRKKSKKTTEKKISRKNVYDFDDDEEYSEETEEDEEEIPKEIMSTNTIPSNQLIKNPKRTQSFMNMDDLVQINNKQQASANLSLENDQEEDNEDDLNNDFNPDTQKQLQDNEEVFDELAMLCSGQFKTTTKKIDAAYLSQLNQDLFSVDDGEEYDLTMKNKIVDKIQILAEDNSNSNSSEKFQNKEEEKQEEIVKKNIDLFVEEEETKSSSNSSDSSAKKRKVEDILDDEDEEEIEVKNKENEKSNENEEDLDNQGFFDEEAELSGSDDEGGDDEDDDEEDDNSIVFSGDEDKDLPSDEELKEQLGKIYLKDQLDRDKQELRLFKEMYLRDGADSDLSKQNRKKKFRWKHLENESENNRHLYSSDEEDDDEEDDNENEENDQTDESKLKEKSRKFMKKLLEKKNWRTIRHEREQLLLKSKSKDLLSDNEDKDSQELDDIDSSNSQSKDMLYMSSSSTNTNELLKKGQQLLKQKNINSNNNSNPSANTANSNVSKFSFLNRDKTYLNRISSYVNKNIYGSSSLKGSSTARSNMMVFSSIDINQTETTSTNDDTNKKTLTHVTSTTRSVKVTAISSNEAKRFKYNNDNCESIFNHIN